MTGEPIRWGILGTGDIAVTFASDLAYSNSGKVEAVGSRSRDKAESFASQYGVPHAHGSYESLVNNPEVDVVYVATPNPMHYANAMLALEHGKPVLVEKTFTMTAAEARDLVENARAKRLFLMEAMWTRFLPHVVEIRQILSSGVLGELVTVLAEYGEWFPLDPTSVHFAPELGGGALLDVGIYPVSFASMVFGAPNRVVAVVDKAFTGVDGQTSMILGYSNGVQSVLSCNSYANSPTRAAIVGTEARIEIDEPFYSPTSFTLIHRSGERVRYDKPHMGHGLYHEANEVAACIARGQLESEIMPLDESIAIMETLDSVLEIAAN